MRDAAPSRAAGRVSAALLQFPFSIRAATSTEKAKRFFDRARLNKLRTRQFDPKQTVMIGPTNGRKGRESGLQLKVSVGTHLSFAGGIQTANSCRTDQSQSWTARRH
jgi:hypothetical protein